jgi:hypothetical protein
MDRENGRARIGGLGLNSAGATSAQNSGAGIAGHSGNKSGAAVKSGPGTVGSTAPNQQNPTVQQQDPSNIKGLPGNKSGPSEKQPPCH